MLSLHRPALRRVARCAVAVATAAGALVVPASTVTAEEGHPTLVAIRAAHHAAGGGRVAYDRLVFEFDGDLPEYRTASWVTEPRYGVADYEEVGPAPVSGNAFLEVRFYSATGHDWDTGRSTYGPSSRAYTLPNIMQVLNNEDFEATMGFLVGVSRRAPFRMSTLTSPSRLVIDLDAAFETVPVRAYFQDLPAYQVGRTPDTVAVTRRVLPPATARGALQRLFAGPTQAEYARGLRFVSSGARGFSNLSITDGVARVRLTWRCDSGGSTFTVANLIVPTLKQFSSVQWVKIYDPQGRTERPTGRTDSIPECLEP